MSGQDVELDQLRAGVSCAVLLERLQPGWLLDEEESTAKCLKYRRSAGEVLIINHGGRGWWDPMGEARGDVFSLAQHLDPGLNFGQVRKLLRGMVGMRPSGPVPERKRKPRDAPAIPVAQRWEQRKRLSRGSATWGYLTGRDFASSDGHMVEDVGENAHVQHGIPHGVADGVLARDDADSVERHALERSAVARAVVAPHVPGDMQNPVLRHFPCCCIAVAWWDEHMRRTPLALKVLIVQTPFAPDPARPGRCAGPADPRTRHHCHPTASRDGRMS